jgi:hypothetical protein
VEKEEETSVVVVVVVAVEEEEDLLKIVVEVAVEGIDLRPVVVAVDLLMTTLTWTGYDR